MRRAVPRANKAVIGLKCWYCGDPAFNFDHRIPRSRARGVGEGNKVPACLSCNSMKGTLSVDEFRDYLRKHSQSSTACRRPRLWRVIRNLEPHNFVFFGEREWATSLDGALEKIGQRHKDLLAFVGNNKLWRGWLRENNHLDSDKPARAYWHAGYIAALGDILNLLGCGKAPKRFNNVDEYLSGQVN